MLRTRLLVSSAYGADLAFDSTLRCLYDPLQLLDDILTDNGQNLQTSYDMAYIMERSSPLAAMQAPSLPFNSFGCRGQSQSAYAEMQYGHNTFNFKDLSMSRTSMDYFSLKPIRGSSPTASLAADLSQNMHIDQRYTITLDPSSLSNRVPPLTTICSPQLPTPRRSLFSSNLFGTITGRGNMGHLPPVELLLKSYPRNTFHTTSAFLLPWTWHGVHGDLTTTP